MLKYFLRAVYCLFLGRLWMQSQYISAMSETQGLSREQFPTEHDSSSGTRAMQRRYGGNRITETGQHVNYFCLMFHFYF